MKQKKYEKENSLIIITIIVFIIELIFSIHMFTKKIPTYKKIPSIIIKKDLVSIIVSKKERELFYKNKKIYLNNKPLKYEIEKDNGVLLKKDKNYYQLILKIKINKKYKTGDIIDLTIMNQKKTIFKVLKNIGKGAD